MWTLSPDFFGYTAIFREPPRIEGRDLVLRSRHVVYDRSGLAIRSVTLDGVRVTNGAMFAHLFVER